MPRGQGPSHDDLRRWAMLLDSAFRVPGTNVRFGFDAIVGLIPGLGDLAAPIFTVLLLVHGVRRGVPAVVQARMVFNALIDLLLGLVPVVGDLADVAWKANLRNLALLERHSVPGARPQAGDYLFVFLCVFVVLVLALLPALAVAYLVTQVPRLL